MPSLAAQLEDLLDADGLPALSATRPMEATRHHKERGEGHDLSRPGAAPAAARAITAAVVFLTRKRIAWEVYLDMPVGLTPGQEPGTGTPMISQLHLGEPSPGPAGSQEGWLVALGITNPGHTPVRGRDFSAPLTFAFPGREIQATQISPGPTGPAASTVRQLPAARVSAANLPAGNHAARLELSGDFILRPGASYSLMIILSGTPDTSSRPIEQEGSLTNGKIITMPGI